MNFSHPYAIKPMRLLAMPRRSRISQRRAKDREGFHSFKLKIDVKPLADGIATAHAVREAIDRKDSALR